MAKTKPKSRAAAKPAKPVARAKPVAKAKASAKASPKTSKPVSKANKAAAKPTPSVKRPVVASKSAAKPSAARKPVAKAAPAKKLVNARQAPVKTVKPSTRPAPTRTPAKATAAPAKTAAKVSPSSKPSEIVTESKKAKSTPSLPSATLKPRAANDNENGITMQDGRYALPANARIDLPNGYRPSSKEEYMNPKHLEFYRRKLQGWRADLVEESKQTIENLRDEVRDVGDEAERATRETENSLELRTRDRYRKLIAKIDKALKRIEEGRYGFCEETDEEIGLDRLEARPIATLCLDAQERWEHRQKQMGD